MSGPPPSTARTADDAEIVAQSLGQPELFARLCDRYAPDIHRYAARRLGDSAADDVTQRSPRRMYQVMAALPADGEQTPKVLRERNAVKDIRSRTQARNDYSAISDLPNSDLMPAKGMASLYRDEAGDRT